MGLHILNLLNDKAQAAQNDSLSGIWLTHDCVFRHKIGAGTFGLIYLVEEHGRPYAAKILLRDTGLAARGNMAEQKKAFQRRVRLLFLQPLAVAELELQCLEALADDFRHEPCLETTKEASGGKIALFLPLLKEVSLHLRVHRHPNIATVHKVYTVQDTALVTLMEYFPQGDLFGAIIELQIFRQHRQTLMKNCMLQLIEAVQHCARNGIFHCDLKPENIMVCYNPSHLRQNENEPIDYQELKVCLIDFGLAMASDLVCCNVCRGSNFYMAPERIVNFNTNRLVRSLVDMEQFPGAHDASDATRVYFPTLAGDIWSLGVLFINVTCARNPWPMANIDDRHDVFFKYILGDQAILRAILPILVQFNNLLNKIFVLNPRERVSLGCLAQMVRSCDFFSEGTVPCKAADFGVAVEPYEYVS